jgi:hypothetical protein
MQEPHREEIERRSRDSHPNCSDAKARRVVRHTALPRKSQRVPIYRGDPGHATERRLPPDCHDIQLWCLSLYLYLSVS